MAVTQYIGSRYVPLFADPEEWSADRPYEPLTIVIHEGASYTSKQAVPIGIGIDNKEFWALTGNYNAQVEQYRREVAGLADDIAANAKAIKDEAQARQDGDAALSGDISGLSDDISAEATARAAADNEIRSLITAEESARQTADTQLTTDIKNVSDAVAAEAQARADADAAVEAYVDKAIADVESELGRSFLGNYIAPTYLGDFIDDRQFGAVCKRDNRIYTASPDNWANTGIVRVFDLVTNSKTTEYTVPMGHGNSFAWDPIRDKFYIAPIYTYSSGTETVVNGIYEYPSDFSGSNLVSMPHAMFAASVDPTDGSVYCAGIQNSAGNGPVNVYRMAADKSEFTLYKTIPQAVFDAAGHVSPWQDMAVYDGVAYFVHTEGTMYLVDLTADEMKILDTYTIGAIDAQGYWRYGEVEGIEFAADGTLLNARNAPCGVTASGAHHEVNCSFVTELNTKSRAYVDYHTIQGTHGSFTIEAGDANKFRLDRTHLRSLNQINWLLDTPSTVLIPSSETVVDNRPIRITANHAMLSLCVEGKYTTESIIFDGGVLGIFVNDNAELNFTSTSREPVYIYNTRVADIHFRNRGTVTYRASSFSRIGYANVNTYILQMNNPSTMKFGSNVSITKAPTCIVGNAKFFEAS